MSTEEQRAKWREASQQRRDSKSGATAPKGADKIGDAPGFLTLEVQETYVISGGDGTSIALTRSEVEALFQWWKRKRKAA